MSPSKSDRKVEGQNGIEPTTSSFLITNDQSLGFHGLGQPGAASNSQEQPGAELGR